jgi:hypothetical protein
MHLNVSAAIIKSIWQKRKRHNTMYRRTLFLSTKNKNTKKKNK